jgi:hypothetical protein
MIGFHSDGDDECRCMKGGSVIETGTHQELLNQQGEYAHLYNVQAQAFTWDLPSPSRIVIEGSERWNMELWW